MKTSTLAIVEVVLRNGEGFDVRAPRDALVADRRAQAGGGAFWPLAGAASPARLGTTLAAPADALAAKSTA